MSGDSDTSIDTLTALAIAAQRGDRQALEDLCRGMQAPMYRLALRFTGNPTDAQDETQEVMIRLVTHLSSFEGRSRFTTWAYTLASRQLLRSSQRRTELSVAGPEAFGEFLDRNATKAFDPEDRVVYAELTGDVRLSCTYGMLMCLTREQRIAYLIDDLLGFTDREAAEICDASPAAFRQRLSRSRAIMRVLMGRRCGLVRVDNHCRCDRLVDASIEMGLLDPANPQWVRHRGVVLPIETETLQRAAAELDLAVAVAEVYRDSPRFEAPAEVWAGLSHAMPELLRR